MKQLPLSLFLKLYEEKYILSKDGKVFDKNKLCYKAPTITGNKKKYVIAYIRKDKHQYHEYLHRLLAFKFIENPNNYNYVNHLDNNGLNNNITNLEWVTDIQNKIHFQKFHNIKPNIYYREDKIKRVIIKIIPVTINKYADTFRQLIKIANENNGNYTLACRKLNISRYWGWLVLKKYNKVKIKRKVIYVPVTKKCKRQIFTDKINDYHLV